MTDFRVVLGEDDDGHALLVRRNFERAGFAGELTRCRDGQEVLDLLAAGRQERATRPTLLLLDINMPRVDGVEVLRRIKGDPATAKVPVIVLTTTDDPREVARCYQLGCNVYVTKPVVYEQFVEAITRLGMFLSVVRVPDYDG